MECLKFSGRKTNFLYENFSLHFYFCYSVIAVDVVLTVGNSCGRVLIRLHYFHLQLEISSSLSTFLPGRERLESA